jgi:hypothetical protein
LQKKDGGVTDVPPFVITPPRPGPVVITIPNNGRPIKIDTGKPTVKIGPNPDWPGYGGIFDVLDPSITIVDPAGNKPSLNVGLKVKYRWLFCDLKLIIGPTGSVTGAGIGGGMEWDFGTIPWVPWLGPIRGGPEAGIDFPLGPGLSGKKDDPTANLGWKWKFGLGK